MIHLEIVNGGIDWELAAAWTQAIGSAIAIYLAARLIRLEALHRAVASMEAFRGVIYAAKALVDESANAAEENLMGNFQLANVQSRRFKQVLALLDSTPTFELGSTKAAFELLALTEDIHKLSLIKSAHGAAVVPAAKIYEIRDIRARTDQRFDLVNEWVQGRRWRRAWWWWFWTPKRLGRATL